MGQIVTLRGLGTVGMLRDAARETIPLEAFTAAHNVRFRPEFVERMRGDAEIFDNVTDAPRWMMYWPLPQEKFWIYGTETKLWRVDQAGIHTDVSRTSGAYNVTSNAFWTGGSLGGIAFANYGPGLVPPQSFDFTAGRFVDLPNWPANTYCNVLRAHKNFLLAANLQVGVERFHQLLRWSSPAAPGAIPSSWDISNPATSAGEIPLGETAGAILDIAPWKDHLTVLKEDAVYGVQFTGGQEVFRSWLIFSDIGALCPNAWVNLPVGQLIVTPGNIVVHNGQHWESIVDRKNRTWFFNSLHPTYFRRLVAVRHIAANEVWIGYPDVNSEAGELNTALVWNWKDNTFTVRDLPDASFLLPSARPVVSDALIYNNADVVYNEADFFYNSQEESDSNFVLLMPSAKNTAFYVAGEGTTINGQVYQSFIERLSLPIVKGDQQERPALDLQTRKLIQRIYPQIESSSSVRFYFGVQESLAGGVTWKGPYIFTPGSQRKLDLLLNTRFLSYRLESDSAFRFYGLDIEYTHNGRT
jgi:hypothetical protein